ncbi:SDR family NAD(P)-dependent oxidoreductase [Polymorphospora rubra]|uniref:SDR family NAD(P)-dependent oxidoreductase n=1 Tax=Polymorphospora rubra TaxID=338584 RepID=UPI0033D177F1
MAYAEAALEVGDRVVLTARRPEELHAWAQAHGDRVLVLPLDVTDAGQVESAVRAAEEHFGGIDVLVNNAGRGWYGSIEGTAEDDVRRMFELNFFGVLSVIRAALPGMRARRSGWIINMSSVAGLRGVNGFGYYSATKYAIEAVTEVLREEVAPLGIRVMAVEPGPSAPGPTPASPTNPSRRPSRSTGRCWRTSAPRWSTRTASSPATRNEGSVR